MNVYLTGRLSEDETKYQAAVALCGKLFKLEETIQNTKAYSEEEYRQMLKDGDVESKDDYLEYLATPCNDDIFKTEVDVLCKTMLKTEDFLKKHPVHGMLIKDKGLEFHTDLFGTSRKVYDLQYSNKRISDCRIRLMENLNTNKVFVNDLINSNIRDSLTQRVFNPEKEQTYHFKAGDLVACVNQETGKSTDMFAYVVEADKKKNTLYLDKYTDRGGISWKMQLQQLQIMELEQFYRPMTDDEILEFRDNLAKLLSDPRKSRKLDAPYTTNETYKAVCEAADEIEARQKQDKEIE